MHNNDDLSAANMFLFYSSSSSSAGTDNRPPMNVVLIHAILIRSDDCNTIDRPTPRMIRQTTSPPIIIHILASISRHLCPFSSSLIITKIVNIILYPDQSLKLSSVFIVQMYGFEMVTNVQKCCAIICFITGTGDESTFGGNFFWPNLRQICNCFCNLSKFWWQQISDKSVELLLSSQILLLLPCALLSGVLKQIIESMS